jgi:tRNA(fMet)-specific endonuclease VapC
VKVFVDTPVIVEIERKNRVMITLIKALINKNVELILSIVTISEILTGCYLREDYKKASSEAKRILSQFIWIDLDSKIAEKIAEYSAYLIKKGKMIEYPDTVIAATFSSIGGDYLLTLNKSHFELIPELNGKVFNAIDLKKKLGL